MLSLKDKIPNNNPLADAPYWGSTDGKNINALACLEWVEVFLQQMDKELPCAENPQTLWHIRQAIQLQKDRIRRRLDQGVLGTSQPHAYMPYGVPDDIA